MRPQTMSGELTGTPGDGNDLNNNGECTRPIIPTLPAIFPTPSNTSTLNLQVPYANLKSIWDCPKINKVSTPLENGKLQAGWRCEWCQTGDQMFKTAHATKALAHVLGLPKCDIRACRGVISESYMILYRDLYQRTALAAKERNHTSRGIDDRGNQRLLNQQMSASAFVNLADEDDGEGGNEDARKRPANVSSISSNSLLPSKFARGTPRRPRGSPPQRQQMKLCGRDLNNPIANQRMDIAVADFFHSNCLPFSLTRCPKFIKVIAEAKNVGTKYQTPDRNRMSGPLLDGLYESNYDEMMRTLLIDSRIFGISIFGDGATITNTPLINILAASPNNPSALLEIVDCTDQMASGGKKDASYLANLVRPCIGMIEAKANTSKQQNHQAVVDLVQFGR